MTQGYSLLGYSSLRLHELERRFSVLDNLLQQNVDDVALQYDLVKEEHAKRIILMAPDPVTYAL